MDAFGQIAGGPALGALGTLCVLRVALVTAGALRTPAIPLLWRATERAPVYPVAQEEVQALAAEVEAEAAHEAIG